MRASWKVLLASALAALLSAAIVAAPSGAASTATASACVPATDIEAIVDDSGSMEITDPNRLRVQGLDLLIHALPEQTQLGAIEFGSGFSEQPAAVTIFPPQPVGPNAVAMETALGAVVNADNGATDYNAAFAKADADNPDSQARIFLTDGGHNVDTYNEAHLAHNVPTYVVGFGSGLALPEDQARLQKIAADTGGQVFSLEDTSELQAVINEVGAALTCKPLLRTFVDKLIEGHSKVHVVPVGASTKALNIALSWASPLDKFKLTHLKLIVNGKVVAAARPKVRKLKVKRTNRATFALVKVYGLRKGKLRFSVKATKVGSGVPKATLTTQVGRGSGR